MDPATFVVVRSRPNGGAVEGLVVDRDALVSRLRTRVLDEQGLGALARVASVARRSRGSSRTDGADSESYLDFESAYSFSHRFAAPFEHLQARLDLAPLSEAGTTGPLLLTLTLGLALAIVLGLWALYRMVAVQVRFAQRRNNFVAAVSHELKTPLTAIRMYGEMLRDDLVESDDKRQEYYRTISAETERLSRLINNVLELARLERGEGPLQLRVGDPGQLTAEVVELFRPHAEREGFALELTLDPDLPSARFDRDGLTQVLFNLLDNALKYGRSEQAMRRIEVLCMRQGERVVVAVRDQGPGVEPTHLRSIFEPFYRGEDELTRKQQGTGIGLALVSNLVNRMRGEVEGRNLRPGFEVRVTLAAG